MAKGSRNHKASRKATKSQSCPAAAVGRGAHALPQVPGPAERLRGICDKNHRMVGPLLHLLPLVCHMALGFYLPLPLGRSRSNKSDMGGPEEGTCYVL